MSQPKTSSPATPAVIDGLWRRDVSAIAAAPRRVAHYVLRMLARCPVLQPALADDDFLAAAWQLVQPLVDDKAFDRLCVNWRRRDQRINRAAGHLVGRRYRDETDDYRHPDALRLTGSSMKRELLKRFGNIPAALLAGLDEADSGEPVNASVALLAQAAGLDRLEAAVMDFVSLEMGVAAFRSMCSYTKTRKASDHHACIAGALDVPVPALRHALRRSGSLAMMQLVRAARRIGELDDYLEIGEVLDEVLAIGPTTTSELIDCFAERPHLVDCGIDDFPHLAEDARRLQTVLDHALRDGAAGVNALLYGAPGTGKTQFALAVALALELTPMLVKTTGDRDDGLQRDARLGAFQLLQRLLRGRRDCVVIFDEVEDVFENPGAGFWRMVSGQPPAGRDKGWMNRVLENNPVPAIWITNNVDSMDRAFLRRFLVPIAFVTPPRSVRLQIAQRHLAQAQVSASLLDELSGDEKLLPAQFAAARRLLELQPDSDPEEVVRNGLSASRRLLHGGALPMRRRSATRFDMAYVNLAGGIAADRIGDALARSGRGSLCFYGAPGTGKTELAHHLAVAMDRELIVRRASSLVSCWHGETEQNIARMFAEIDVQRQILFLDEVDSFLRDRRKAQQSWQVSEVNELLQQMECFPGIFIAASNLMGDIDPAALRRFDFKLNFRPLNPRQRLSLFAREALGDENRIDELPTAFADALVALETLTVGDFANVARQRDLLGETLSPENFLRRLALECRWKHGAVDMR